MKHKRLHILIVEDSHPDAFLVLRELKKGGYEPIHECVNSREGMEQALAEDSWDLVIVDYNVPGFGGLEALELLKKKGEALPAILVSGVVGEEIAVEAMKAGAYDYVMKDHLARLAPAVERALREAKIKQERDRLARAKDDFVNTVSHELRTPISILQMGLSNLKKGYCGPISPQQQELVDMMMNSSRRLSTLINDILDLSFLESGKINVNFQEVDVDSIIRRTLPGFGFLTEKEKKELHYDQTGELPKVYADEEMIERVLTNLLSNAVRFAKHHVTVEAKEGGEGVQVAVMDDGPGIEAEAQSRIFNKFEQFHRSKGGSGYKGTGLGLAICKQIVKQHGGKIWVETAAGKGAKFMVTLPAETKKEEANG